MSGYEYTVPADTTTAYERNERMQGKRINCQRQSNVTNDTTKLNFPAAATPTSTTHKSKKTASPILELSSIGREKEPAAPDRNRVNSSQMKKQEASPTEELPSIGRRQEPTAEDKKKDEPAGKPTFLQHVPASLNNDTNGVEMRFTWISSLERVPVNVPECVLTDAEENANVTGTASGNNDDYGGEELRFPSLFPPAPLTARTTQQEASCMIEQQEDGEEKYDEAYLRWIDIIVASQYETSPALSSSVGAPSTEPVVNQTGQSQSGLTLVFFCVIICLTIPDKLQALAVSAFACLLAQDQAFALYQSVSSSVWSLVSSLPSVSSLWSSISSAGYASGRVDPVSVSVGALSAPSVGAFTTPALSSSVGAPPSRIVESAADPHAVSVVSQPLILPLDMDVAVNISPWADRSSDEPGDPFEGCVAELQTHGSVVEWEKSVESAMAAVFMKPEPGAYKQALDIPGWHDSLQRQVSSMYDQQVWEDRRIADLPPITTVIDFKWVYKDKPGINGDRSIADLPPIMTVIDFKWVYKDPDIQKSCGVARRDQEDEVEEEFSPVSRLEPICLMFTQSVIWDLECTVCDVLVAFLNAPIPADKPQVFMHLPLGFKKPGYVFKLKKCIYRLQGSPRLMNQMFNSYLLSIGFENSKIEPCLDLRKNEKTVLIVLIYVDDLMASDTHHGADITSYCGLGFHRDHSNRTGEITMDKYIEKMLFTFALQDVTPSLVPYKVGQEVGEPEPEYRSSIQ